jgi:hypothetical protein
MGINDRHPAILKVLALEKKLLPGQGKDREGARALRLADCAAARQAVEAVEAARPTLPTIVYSTLLHRVEHCEQSLAEQER